MRVNEKQGVHIQGEIWEFLLFYMLARIKDTTLVEILIQEEIQVLLRSLEVVLIQGGDACASTSTTLYTGRCHQRPTLYKSKGTTICSLMFANKRPYQGNLLSCCWISTRLYIKKEVWK